MQQLAFPLCAKWLPEKINVGSQDVHFQVRYLNLCTHTCICMYVYTNKAMIQWKQ